MNCAYEDGFSAWDALVAVTLTPLAAFVLVLLVAKANVFRLRRRAAEASGGKAHSWAVGHILGYFFQGMLLVLPTISRRIFQSFRCKSFDDGEVRLLEMDLEIDW